MIKVDEKLRDIRNRCSRAKDELSVNLHARLRWVMFVQRQLADVDSRLVLQNENLRRLRRHVDLLRQLHLAPSVYLRSLVEAVRRKQFAVKFLHWASWLSGETSPINVVAIILFNGFSRTISPGNCMTLYQEETVLRKSFNQTCDGHFLSLLFPAMVDQFPPAFATVPPPAFDTALPPITVDDLESLKNALPSLWNALQLPDNLKVLG